MKNFGEWLSLRLNENDLARSIATGVDGFIERLKKLPQRDYFYENSLAQVQNYLQQLARDSQGGQINPKGVGSVVQLMKDIAGRMQNSAQSNDPNAKQLMELSRELMIQAEQMGKQLMGGSNPVK
jgi:hypothetical protein